MNIKMVGGLYAMCEGMNPSLERIEAYIKSNGMSGEEVTLVAARLLYEYSFEPEDFEWQNGRKPEPHELVSSGFVELFELFIRCGFDPCLVVYEDENHWFNVLDELFTFDNSAVSLPIAEKLLKLGGDPNVMLDDETLFDRVDFDIVFGAVEQENRERYNGWVRFWFLLMGYGGRRANGSDAVNLVNGYTMIFSRSIRSLISI